MTPLSKAAGQEVTSQGWCYDSGQGSGLGEARELESQQVRASAKLAVCPERGFQQEISGWQGRVEVHRIGSRGHPFGLGRNCRTRLFRPEVLRRLTCLPRLRLKPVRQFHDLIVVFFLADLP